MKNDEKKRWIVELIRLFFFIFFFNYYYYFYLFYYYFLLLFFLFFFFCFFLGGGGKQCPVLAGRIYMNASSHFCFRYLKWEQKLCPTVSALMLQNGGLQQAELINQYRPAFHIYLFNGKTRSDQP